MRVGRVIICTPDKDLAQSVRGDRIVQLNRRTGEVRTEPDVVKKFGVGPASIPDWLALVGDSSDGYPGLPGWGPKSASEVLARFKRLEDIPRDYREWHANVRNAGALARVLGEQRDLAFLFRDLATLRTDVPVFGSVDELRWTGPRPEFEAMAAKMESAT
jgi:5'-3' exonuclease